MGAAGSPTSRTPTPSASGLPLPRVISSQALGFCSTRPFLSQHFFFLLFPSNKPQGKPCTPAQQQRWPEPREAVSSPKVTQLEKQSKLGLGAMSPGFGALSPTQVTLGEEGGRLGWTFCDLYVLQRHLASLGPVSSSLRWEGCQHVPGMGGGQPRAAPSSATQAGKKPGSSFSEDNAPSPLGKSLPGIQGHLGVLGDHVVQGDLWAESQMVTRGQPPAHPILQSALPSEPHLWGRPTPPQPPQPAALPANLSQACPSSGPRTLPLQGHPSCLSYYNSVLTIHAPRGHPEPPSG